MYDDLDEKILLIWILFLSKDEEAFNTSYATIFMVIVDFFLVEVAVLPQREAMKNFWSKEKLFAHHVKYFITIKSIIWCGNSSGYR